MRSICLAVIALALSCPALAVVEPAAAPKKEDDPSKFFWFHKAGTDFATAKTDISYCFIQTGTIRAAQKPSTGAGGLIGALVSGIINGITESVEGRRMRDSGMRTCMGMYRYDRYAVPETEWNSMMRATDAVDRLATYASGATPVTGKLLP